MDASTSSSSSSVTGLHGGDLRSPNGELSTKSSSSSPYRNQQQQQQQQQNGGRTSVMDNGRSAHATTNNNHYRTPTNNNNTSSSMTSAASRINRRPPSVNNFLSPKKKSRVIIDLTSPPPQQDDDEDEECLAAARKKRSLQRNITHTHTNNNNVYKATTSTSSLSSGLNGSSSLTQQYSPPPRQQKRTRVGVLHLHHQQQQSSSLSQLQQQHHQAPPPINHITLPSRHTQDGATITFGLLSLIDILNRNTTATNNNNINQGGRRKSRNNNDNNDIRFCEGCCKSSMDKLFKPLDPTLFGAAAAIGCGSSVQQQVPTTTTAMAATIGGAVRQQTTSTTQHPTNNNPPTLSSLPLPYNHQPFHYLQNDNWSCGYRNLQMLLSSMLPTLSSLYPRGVPTINEIQVTMEKLWKFGYDNRNAIHHEHLLVGKKTWIGTGEVWSYLSFQRVDSIIIQFIKKEENRALLGKFVWAYFNRICGSVGCTCCCCLNNNNSNKGDDDNNNNLFIEKKERENSKLASPSVLASEYADNLLKEMGKSNFDTRVGGGVGVEEPYHPTSSRCKCSLPPLYLQWDGHSVTVIGVKRIIGSNNEPPSYTLIIFCPQKKLGTIKCQLAKELHSRKMMNINNSNTTTTTNISSSNTPVATTTTTTQPYSFGTRIESMIELPADKLLHKDCQLLLSTAKVIDENESSRRKSCIQNIGFLNATAASKEMK